MPRTQLTPDSATIARWRAAGRGHGEGITYHPWLTVQDVPSTSFSHRIDGLKTQRVHHLLSTLELAFFYLAEWSPLVVDIREQYPLFEVEETCLIAERCGLWHPLHPTDRTPLVLTTDFLLTVQRDGERVLLARTIKPTKDLSQRMLEKFEIERRYWAARGISWKIVTERELPTTFTQNMHLLHAHYFPDPSWDPDLLRATVQMLTDLVLAPHRSLAALALICDQRLGCAPGTSLQIAYYLIATWQWQVDLFVPLQPAQPLTVTGTAIHIPALNQ
ncbi:MAG TPA: TnsA endonuclease N-terminal domain-containing protein [Ktedonobacterales bacterium]|nr:TnsA endonuclease N-terminal domain-containing protein [Ktedonobacterales bacterium]